MTAPSPDRQRRRLAGYIPTRLFLLALAGAVACGPTVNEVRVEPGAAPNTPVFLLTDTTGTGPSGLIYGLSVLRCGADSASWTITALGSRTTPDRIVYGKAPEGYSTTIGPRPLRSGCYEVYVTDGRRARFQVDGAGRLVIATPRRDTMPARPDSDRH